MVRAQEKTVLVVDDEPNVRDYLAQILRDAGFQVQTAGDGGEALEMIRREPPDFISLDLVMPRKRGFRAGVSSSAIRRQGRDERLTTATSAVKDEITDDTPGTSSDRATWRISWITASSPARACTWRSR
jgi:DNA-binding response OmpR family regulator